MKLCSKFTLNFFRYQNQLKINQELQNKCAQYEEMHIDYFSRKLDCTPTKDKNLGDLFLLSVKENKYKNMIVKSEPLSIYLPNGVFINIETGCIFHDGLSMYFLDALQRQKLTYTLSALLIEANVKLVQKMSQNTK